MAVAPTDAHSAAVAGANQCWTDRDCAFAYSVQGVLKNSKVEWQKHLIALEDYKTAQTTLAAVEQQAYNKQKVALQMLSTVTGTISGIGVWHSVAAYIETKKCSSLIGLGIGIGGILAALAASYYSPDLTSSSQASIDLHHRAAVEYYALNRKNDRLVADFAKRIHHGQEVAARVELEECIKEMEQLDKQYMSTITSECIYRKAKLRGHGMPSSFTSGVDICKLSEHDVEVWKREVKDRGVKEANIFAAAIKAARAAALDARGQ